jgi:hypothetical protein
MIVIPFRIAIHLFLIYIFTVHYRVLYYFLSIIYIIDILNEPSQFVQFLATPVLPLSFIHNHVIIYNLRQSFSSSS